MFVWNTTRTRSESPGRRHGSDAVARVTTGGIVIVDYGLGNLASILNMLRKVGARDAAISSDAGDIARAGKLILPGVGAFDNGMANLAERGLIPVLNERVRDAHIPVLGICLGLQLFAAQSEEGRLPGLGWIDADTVRFDAADARGSIKVPHMGWNTMTVCGSSPLFDGLGDDTRFYFVHSYHLRCRDADDVTATTHYGYDFPASVRRGNIMGTQFHPEKSHKYGARLLKNFVDLA